MIDKIIEMARQAGIKRKTDVFYSEYCDGIYGDDLEAFAKLVAAKERENVIQHLCGLKILSKDGAFIDEIRARGEA